MYTKTCEECGTEFKTSYKRQRFCKNPHFRNCEICGKSFLLKKLPSDTKTCSKQCAFEKSRRDGTMQKGREKSKQTMLERYGVEHALQSDEFLQKSKDTLQEHYGVDNPMRSSELKEAARITNIERYGVDNPAKSDSVKLKIEQTLQARYGVKNAMQYKEFQDRQRASTKQSCGAEFALQSDVGKQHLHDTLLEKYGVDTTSGFGVPEIRKKAQDTIESRYGSRNIGSTQYWRGAVNKTMLDRYGVNWAVQTPQCREAGREIISKANKWFGQVLSDLNIEFEFEKSVWFYNYDICIESQKLLIEIDPTYTHNSFHNHYLEHGVPSTYHLNKSKCAESNGYQCIHVFDWDDVEKIVDMLKDKKLIYARNCEIRKIEVAEALTFESKYHLQGGCRGQKHCYGTYFDNELIQVMTFGKPRYTSKYDFELMRLCTKTGYQVIGGASRLFKAFVRELEGASIISYCDLSKFSGQVYGKLGMKLKEKTPPAIVWSRGSKYIRDSLLRARGYDQLFGTSYGKGTSNYDLMIAHRWLPVYDCGQATYEYK